MSDNLVLPMTHRYEAVQWAADFNIGLVLRCHVVEILKASDLGELKQSLGPFLQAITITGLLTCGRR